MLEKAKAPGEHGWSFKPRAGRLAHRKNMALEVARFIGSSMLCFSVADNWMNPPKTNNSV